MAVFQTPQFIDTKPKIIGPLTLAQFFYLAGAAALSFIAFQIFNLFLAFSLTVIFGSLGLALAFVKINGQDLPKILIAALNYFLNPRLYTWQRTISETTIELPEENIFNLRQNMSLGEKLKDLAQKVTTGKFSLFEIKRKQKTEERYQIIRKLTGEREIAKRVDYS